MGLWWALFGHLADFYHHGGGGGHGYGTCAVLSRWESGPLALPWGVVGDGSAAEGDAAGGLNIVVGRGQEHHGGGG